MKITNKWAYLTCIVCDKVRYKSLKALEKMLQTQTKEEIVATFKCSKCKKNETI